MREREMELGFKPKTKDDWRMLLDLCKLIRIGNRATIVAMIQSGKATLDTHTENAML